MNTRTKNALILGAALALLAALLTWVAKQRGELHLQSTALDAIPGGALLVARGDLSKLRKTPLAQVLLGEGREIPGLGKVRDVCGMDPLDAMHELVLAIPAAGEEGDFGIAASGDVDDDALVACASKVIEARGGRPVVTPIGEFRCVRDATLAATGGEIAVRKGGPVLLGAGPYLRAMIDAVEGRGPTIRSSVAHSKLIEGVGSADVRITVVLTPDQRRTLDEELGEDKEQADGRTHAASKANSRLGSALMAGAVGLSVGEPMQLKGFLMCESQDACEGWAELLKRAKTKRANDFGTKLLGFGEIFSRIEIQARGETVVAKVSLSGDEAKQLLEKVLVLRGGTRHPMPREMPERAAPPELPRPDAVIPAVPSASASGAPGASTSGGTPRPKGSAAAKP